MMSIWIALQARGDIELTLIAQQEQEIILNWRQIIFDFDQRLSISFE